MKDLRCIICGMNINDKNYSLNSSAVINKNNENNFITCPFCGAGSNYIKLDEDVYFHNIKNIDNSTAKILDHAMKLEVFNGEFYRAASNLASEEKVKDLFKALSRIEMMHARIHQKLGGFDKLPVLQKIDYSRFTSDVELLQAAKQREEHAIAYYSKYINDLCDERIKVIFLALSAVEKEHITLTFI